MINKMKKKDSEHQRLFDVLTLLFHFCYVFLRFWRFAYCNLDVFLHLCCYVNEKFALEIASSLFIITTTRETLYIL